MNTYTVRQSQTIYKYATVRASSKAEALKQAEDLARVITWNGDADFDDVTEHDNATYKVVDVKPEPIWFSKRVLLMPTMKVEA